jgi:small subunit ribosomal protein S11
MAKRIRKPIVEVVNKKPDKATMLSRNRKDVLVIIRKTVNNIFMTARDKFKRVIGTCSMGYAGFKGSARLSPIAIEESGIRFGKILATKGCRSVSIVLRTPGFFITQLLKGFQNSSLSVVGIAPLYRYGHNGMRLKKLRRVLIWLLQSFILII